MDAAKLLFAALTMGTVGTMLALAIRAAGMQF